VLVDHLSLAVDFAAFAADGMMLTKLRLEDLVVWDLDGDVFELEEDLAD
jgi:hypothetical protein